MALRSSALIVALLGASASAQHHGMDPFAGSKCTCATFCDGSCDIEDVGQQTMELFRMTQFGVVGKFEMHEHLGLPQRAVWLTRLAVRT